MSQRKRPPVEVPCPHCGVPVAPAVLLGQRRAAGITTAERRAWATVQQAQRRAAPWSVRTSPT